jgi:hypothetical protein
MIPTMTMMTIYYKFHKSASDLEELMSEEKNAEEQ